MGALHDHDGRPQGPPLDKPLDFDSIMTDKTWIKRHLKDEFVRKAQHDGYVARSAYKLLEIQKSDRILRPGMLVVDLGAAPGGWSQVARQFIGKSGKIIAVDLLPLKISEDLVFLQGDFNDESLWQQLQAALTQANASGKADIVISDMAPNLSGSKTIDQPRSQHLVELAFECAQQILKPNGSFLTKVFQGAGTEELIKLLRASFKTLKIRKPKASRAESREVYLLALGFLGYNKTTI